METKPVINVVANQCEPEVEKKFNDWYSQTHAPLLMKLKEKNHRLKAGFAIASVAQG